MFSIQPAISLSDDFRYKNESFAEKIAEFSKSHKTITIENYNQIGDNRLDPYMDNSEEIHLGYFNGASCGDNISSFTYHATGEVMPEEDVKKIISEKGRFLCAHTVKPYGKEGLNIVKSVDLNHLQNNTPPQNLYKKH